MFRLKGKGVQSKDGAGDLLVTPRIVLPEAIDPISRLRSCVCATRGPMIPDAESRRSP